MPSKHAVPRTERAARKRRQQQRMRNRRDSGYSDSDHTIVPTSRRTACHQKRDTAPAGNRFSVLAQLDPSTHTPCLLDLDSSGPKDAVQRGHKRAADSIPKPPTSKRRRTTSGCSPDMSVLVAIREDSGRQLPLVSSVRSDHRDWIDWNQSWPNCPSINGFPLPKIEFSSKNGFSLQQSADSATLSNYLKKSARPAASSRLNPRLPRLLTVKKHHTITNPKTLPETEPTPLHTRPRVMSSQRSFQNSRQESSARHPPERTPELVNGRPFFPRWQQPISAPLPPRRRSRFLSLMPAHLFPQSPWNQPGSTPHPPPTYYPFGPPPREPAMPAREPGIEYINGTPYYPPPDLPSTFSTPLPNLLPSAQPPIGTPWPANWSAATSDPALPSPVPSQPPSVSEAEAEAPRPESGMYFTFDNLEMVEPAARAAVAVAFQDDEETDLGAGSGGVVQTPTDIQVGSESAHQDEAGSDASTIVAAAAPPPPCPTCIHPTNQAGSSSPGSYVPVSSQKGAKGAHKCSFCDHPVHNYEYVLRADRPAPQLVTTEPPPPPLPSPSSPPAFSEEADVSSPSTLVASDDEDDDDSAVIMDLGPLMGMEDVYIDIGKEEGEWEFDWSMD